VGELAGPLTHEVNNLLNNLTLHLAVMQQVGASSLGPDLEAIRRQITRFAGVVSRFQRRRQRERGEPDVVDLNAALTDAARMFAPAAVHLELSPQLPGIRAHLADLRRVCRFLLANGIRALKDTGRPVEVSTQRVPDGVQLTVQDTGTDIAADLLPRIFDPGNESRDGMCCLELAACRSLIRRLRGSIQANSGPDGGLVITVTLPVAQSPD
jgi:signal transduction histidine kinase